MDRNHRFTAASSRLRLQILSRCHRGRRSRFNATKGSTCLLDKPGIISAVLLPPPGSPRPPRGASAAGCICGLQPCSSGPPGLICLLLLQEPAALTNRRSHGVISLCWVSLTHRLVLNAGIDVLQAVGVGNREGPGGYSRAPPGSNRWLSCDVNPFASS